MTVLALLATAADALTLSWAHEANPVILALGDYAYPARAAAIALGFSAAQLAGRSWMRRLVVGVVLVVGIVGAVSNVWARL